MKLLGIILIGYGLILCFIEKFAWYRILWFLAGTGLILATASRIALPFWAEVLAYLPTVLILILIVWIHSNNEKAAQNKDNNPAESIIVLGCKVGSLSFENRTREAVNYLLDHPETSVICSGGQGSDEPYSEAEAFARAIERKGVSEERILKEPNSCNTAENIRNSVDLIINTDAPIGIVTSSYHVYRAVLIAKKAGLSHAFGIPAESVPFYVPDYELREGLAFIKGKLTGEL